MFRRTESLGGIVITQRSFTFRLRDVFKSFDAIRPIQGSVIIAMTQINPIEVIGLSNRVMMLGTGSQNGKE